MTRCSSEARAWPSFSSFPLWRSSPGEGFPPSPRSIRPGTCSRRCRRSTPSASPSSPDSTPRWSTRRGFPGTWARSGSCPGRPSIPASPPAPTATEGRSSPPEPTPSTCWSTWRTGTGGPSASCPPPPSSRPRGSGRACTSKGWAASACGGPSPLPWGLRSSSSTRSGRRSPSTTSPCSSTPRRSRSTSSRPLRTWSIWRSRTGSGGGPSGTIPEATTSSAWWIGPSRERDASPGPSIRSGAGCGPITPG